MNKHYTSGCQDILANLCDYIDNDLDKAECEKLEEHLSNCEDCQTVVKTIKKTIRLCKDSTNDIRLPQETYKRLIKQLGLKEE